MVTSPSLYLAKLEALTTKGISASLLIFDDGSEPVVKGSLSDDISVIANFRAFLNSATQISKRAFKHYLIPLVNRKKDKPNFITLEFEESLVIIQRLSSPSSLGTSLVCVCKKKIPREAYLDCILKTQKLLNQGKPTTCAFFSLLQVFRMLSYYTT